MAPFDLFFVLFLTIPVLIWLIDGSASEPSRGILRNVFSGFAPGFYFGFGYFVSGMWWVGTAVLVDGDRFAWALPLAILALPAVLGLFWGVGTSIACLFWSGLVRRVFMLASCLMLMEYFRGFIATGLPWNSIGYAAFVNSFTMQTASVFGVYAITPFVVLVAALPLLLLGMQGYSAFKRYIFILVWLALVTGHVGYGVWRLDTADTGFVEGVSLRLVQPNIEQSKKFDPEREAEFVKRYLDMSTLEQDGVKLSNVTHLIWPESVFPFLLTERRDVLAAIAAMLPDGTSLVTGAVRAEQGASASGKNLVFNSIYVIDHEGIIVSAADKVHLVPFGEYLPFQDLLESIGIQQLTALEGGFQPGSSRKLLSTGTGPLFLPLICYEIIFSGQVWSGESRPGWIVNLTNDAWFGMTPGPYQHERQAIVRSVEEGLPLVRVANTGISGVYDSYGNVVKRLPLDQQGILDSPLPKALEQTIHIQYGNFIFWTVFVIFFTVGIIPSRKT